ncbi:accessory gland protein Acp29AB-like isoform X1 [Drosophila pseudoobscura]|uniref:Accessory gland protein Acp29AB-like isoform X1 n=1 Tax=Drosophila pseudoobscura pseudoobscura TaxID=46245 RepID=A0A6I8W294_DROPS|nr:accessory gland protein Acp29AB isoform X1 [Drosophila pseudoobscura]
MRFSIVFILLAITFERSLSQHCEVDETQHECGGYCYGAVKPVLEYLAILQKRVENCEAKQPADTLSKIAKMDEKLKTLGRVLAIQPKSERSSQERKLAQIDEKLAALGRQMELEKKTLMRLQRLVLFEKIGSKYYYIENEITTNWRDALHKCGEIEAHLVSLQSEDEMKVLRRKLDKNKRYWTDLNDLKTEGEFISATTGLKGTFFHWQEPEPNDMENSEDCVEIRTFSDKDWMNDQSCFERIYFICEASWDDPFDMTI